MKKSACPLCGKTVDPAHRPFCSERCTRLDQHQWLSGSYALPGEAAPHIHMTDEQETDLG